MYRAVKSDNCTVMHLSNLLHILIQLNSANKIIILSGPTRTVSQIKKRLPAHIDHICLGPKIVGLNCGLVLISSDLSSKTFQYSNKWSIRIVGLNCGLVLISSDLSSETFLYSNKWSIRIVGLNCGLVLISSDLSSRTFLYSNKWSIRCR